MSDLLVLDQAEVRRLLDLDALIDALRAAFIELSSGRASVPARNAAFTGAGLLAAMPGYLPGTALAVKLVTVFDENRRQDLPSHQALILLFDPETGAPQALLEGAYITAVRTAGASAVAALALARPESRTLAILGAGVQARTHLEAFTRCFRLEGVRIAARTRESAEGLAAKSSIAAVSSCFEDAVRGADIVCCCTNAGSPVMERGWLSPGAHVGSVGRGAELDPATVLSGAVFVEWAGAASNPPPAGAVELQALSPAAFCEIGNVLSGSAPGRTSREQITVYKSTGHAVEDAAAAALVYRRALAERVGPRIQV